MAHFGRRTLYLSGQAITFIFVLLIGVLSCVNDFVAAHSKTKKNPSEIIDPHPSPLKWTIAALLLAFTLAYDATLGPICYSLVSEIPSTRLRSKTIVLARNCYNISGIITNIITPRMLNPTAWGWGAKAGFFWAGTSVLGILWSWMSCLRRGYAHGSSKVRILRLPDYALQKEKRTGCRGNVQYKPDGREPGTHDMMTL
jgi:SP family general alpha glucoside:H+ symporter-like MFS transporter